MPTALENVDPPPRSEATITYRVESWAFQRRRRIIVPCQLTAAPVIEYADPTGERRVWLGQGSGFDLPVCVRNGNGGRPVVFTIVVATDVTQPRAGGESVQVTQYLHPIGLLMRQAANGPLSPGSFNGAWVNYETSGRATLVVSDVESVLGDYKFDLLIRDNDEMNYALLDPRLTNS